jgi:hypothetical protein
MTTRAAYEYRWPQHTLWADEQWTGTLPVFSQWHIDALRGVLQLAALPQDWDTYGSPSPSGTAVNASLAILNRVAKIGFEDLAPPHVVPVPGGGIQLEWQADERELELEVSPDGTLLFLKAQAAEPIEEGELALVFPQHELQSLFSWLTATAG